MPIGPGKYDALCSLVRTRAHALAALVIVIGGDKGSGFSVQAPLGLTMQLADLLEQMAREIRASLNEGKL